MLAVGGGADRETVVDAANLRRVLLRLEQQILLPPSTITSATGGPDGVGGQLQLNHSSFERDKAAQNLEYARTLLLRIQHHAANSKGQQQARRHAQQTELTRHRALVKRLTERLYELRRQDDSVGVGGGNGGVRAISSTSAASGPNGVSSSSSSNGGEGEEAEEDLLAQYFPPEATQSKLPSHSRGPSLSKGAVTETNTTSDGLRARNVKGGGETAGLTAVTTTATKASTAIGSSNRDGGITALRSSLFSEKPASDAKTKPKIPAEMSAERRLENQDATQAELTSSLVTLAQQLKASSQAFADDLAADNQSLARTEGSLGRNQEGLEAASRRMGVLRRMTEGRWFFQRYIMFILLAVLWVAEIALVFLGPKLRF